MHKWTDRRADTDVIKQNQKTANCRTSLSHIWFSLCYSSHFTTLNFYIFEYFHSKMLVKVVIKLNDTNKCISMKKKLEKDPFCYNITNWTHAKCLFSLRPLMSLDILTL